MLNYRTSRPNIETEQEDDRPRKTGKALEGAHHQIYRRLQRCTIGCSTAQLVAQPQSRSLQTVLVENE